MRDHDDRLVQLLIELLEHLQHDLRVFRVEITGRFIREDDRRVIDHGTGQGNTLLFAAGKFERLVVHFTFELQEAQNSAAIVGAASAVANVDLFGELKVTVSRQRREKIKSLKDKADLSASDIGPLGVRDLGEILAVDQYAAARRTQQSTEQMQQRRFAAAGRPHDGDEFAFFDLKGHPSKCGYLDFSDLVRLG